MFHVCESNTDPRLLNLFKTCRNNRWASNFEVIRSVKETDQDILAIRGPALWHGLSQRSNLSQIRVYLRRILRIRDTQIVYHLIREQSLIETNRRTLYIISRYF